MITFIFRLKTPVFTFSPWRGGGVLFPLPLWIRHCTWWICILRNFHFKSLFIPTIRYCTNHFLQTNSGLVCLFCHWFMNRIMFVCFFFLIPNQSRHASVLSKQNSILKSDSLKIEFIFTSDLILKTVTSVASKEQCFNNISKVIVQLSAP